MDDTRAPTVSQASRAVPGRRCSATRSAARRAPIVSACRPARSDCRSRQRSASMYGWARSGRPAALRGRASSFDPDQAAHVVNEVGERDARDGASRTLIVPRPACLRESAVNSTPHVETQLSMRSIVATESNSAPDNDILFTAVDHLSDAF